MGLKKLRKNTWCLYSAIAPHFLLMKQFRITEALCNLMLDVNETNVKSEGRRKNLFSSSMKLQILIFLTLDYLGD